MKSGSSPRPWGTRLGRGGGTGCGRFIPTPVGNTRSRCWITSPPPVHPHARGEHRVGQIEFEEYTGSSPRPWGTRPDRRGHDQRRRFIPTPVGNTQRLVGELLPLSVHPHARGEHIGVPDQPAGRDGSSPRPWGTRSRGQEGTRRHRFIPTPVGNTQTAAPTSRVPAVHPHARGEHRSSRPPTRPSGGSSPRPWGTPARFGS